MSKNNKKSLILSILVVLVLGIIITTSTFAYLQWSGGQTSVNVTIEMGGITMHIEPEETNFVGLYPTKISSDADCSRVRYGDALVTIENNTGTLAIPSFKLKVKVTKGGSGELTEEALSHINYAVIPLETTKNILGRPVKGEPMKNYLGESYSCYNYPKGYDDDDLGYGLFVQAYSWNTHLTFESVSTNGSWSHIPQNLDYPSTGDPIITNPAYLPRQYYLSGTSPYQTGDVNGITFRGEAYSTSYQYFRVYVWLDEGYTTTTIGNVVSDPLQNAKIEVTWSEESIVQQVSGESSDQGIAAGLYDSNGNMIYTWQQLLDDGDITVVDNVITVGYGPFPGTLVIADDITVIGVEAFLNGQLSKIKIPSSVTIIEGWAFEWSDLTEITFAENSQLNTIGVGAFGDCEFNKIELPASVTTIGASAFEGCEALEEIKFKGTIEEWNAIEKGENWNLEVPATKVICSDGEVDL